MGAKLKFRRLRCGVGTIYVYSELLAPPEGDLGPRSYFFEVQMPRIVLNRRSDVVPIPRACGMDGGMKSLKVGRYAISKTKVLEGDTQREPDGRTNKQPRFSTRLPHQHDANANDQAFELAQRRDR